MEQITSGTRALPKLKVISRTPCRGIWKGGVQGGGVRPRRSLDSLTLAPLQSA